MFFVKLELGALVSLEKQKNFVIDLETTITRNLRGKFG